MKNTIDKLIISLVFLFFSNTLVAQVGNLYHSDEKISTVYIMTGFDNSILTTSVGYGRALKFFGLNKSIILSLDAGVPLLGSLGLSDYRLRIGTRISLLDKEKFKLPLEVNPIFRGTENGTYKAIGFGTEFNILPGFYGKKWTIASEFGVDQQWATHISHSEFYTTYMYPEAKDGWLYSPSTVIGIGMRVGKVIKNRLDILFRFNYEFRGQFDHDAPPLLGTLTVGYRI